MLRRSMALLVGVLAGAARPQALPLSLPPTDESFEAAVLRRRDPATNTIIICEVNFGFHEMAMNWLAHAARIGLDSGYLLIALDPLEHAALQHAGIDHYYESGGSTKTIVSTSGTSSAGPTGDSLGSTGGFANSSTLFRSSAYNEIVFNKWSLVAASLG